MNWLRNWLGYQTITDRIEELSLHIIKLEEEVLELRNDLTVTFRDEFDPRRKDMSNRLGQRMIQKLKGEDLARRHALGEE